MLPFFPDIRILPISATPINEDHVPEVQLPKGQWQTHLRVLEGPASKGAVDVAQLKFEVVARPRPMPECSFPAAEGGC
jgi:hypothetical protein